MASGTINLTQSATSGKYIDAKIVWSATADTSANTSSVTAKLYVRKGDTTQTLTIATEGTWSYALTINGTNATGTVKLSVLEDWVLVATKTVSSISHDSDGSKSITISGSVTAPTGTSFAGHTTSGSGTATLDTIARASTITSAAAVTLGNKCSIKWTSASTSFRYKLKFSLGNWSYTTGAIHPNQTSAYTYTGYTIPLAVAEQLPDDTSGTMTVTLYTYSNSGATTQVGSSDSETFKVTVPNSSATQPAVTMTLSPVNTFGDAFDGLYIHGKIPVNIVLSATGKYGATISYYIAPGGQSYTGNDFDAYWPATPGTHTLYGYAKDSRGYTGSTSQEITVIAYSKPQIQPTSDETEVVAARCDADGNLSDSGTYLKIKAKRSYSKVDSGGEQRNFCKIRYRYKAESASSYSSWVTILAGDASGDEIVTGALLGGALAVETTYLVQVQAIDDIGDYGYTTITVPTAKVYWHRDGARRSFCFGGYVEEDNTFSIAEDIQFKPKGEKWVSLDLSEEVATSENSCGRGPSGTGCWYRVVNSNHIHVAFNVSFTYAGSYLTITGEAIPEGYRPSRNVYGFACVGGKYIARILITPEGHVVVDWVQALFTGEETTSRTVAWIDGYIDYFVNT